MDATPLRQCINDYRRVKPPLPIIDNRVICAGTGTSDACEVRNYIKYSKTFSQKGIKVK